MHSSQFRSRSRTPVNSGTASPPDSALDQLKAEIAEIRNRFEGLVPAITDLKRSIESLKPSDDIAVPADLAKSVKLIHARLDRLENQMDAIDKGERKREATIANALLTLNSRVAKISGGEDSKFSLAHTLEELIRVLRQPKRIVRNSDGDMTKLIPESDSDRGTNG